jgi:Protein of unknown function, DUF481
MGRPSTAIIALTIAWVATHVVPSPAAAREKTDVVILRNGDQITGEITSLSSGRLVYSTDSVGTINIEWEDIAKLSSPFFYRIEDHNGAVYYGSLAAPEEAGTLHLVQSDGTSALLAMADMAGIMPIEQKFWKRFDGSISIGFSFTQASHATQLSAGVDVTYTTMNAITSLNASSLLTDQDEVDATSRHDASLQYIRNIQRWKKIGWFGRGELQSNEELGLDLRLLAATGIWRALYQDFRSLAAVGPGLAVSEEYAAGSDDAATNTELLILGGYSFSTYDYPKTEISVRGDFYPSLSDWGRVRFEFDANLRRELFHDLFFKISPFESYDSAPPEEGAAKNDWGLSTSLGWEF